MTSSPAPSLTVVGTDDRPSSLAIDVPPGTPPEVVRFVERVGETLEQLLVAIAHPAITAPPATAPDSRPDSALRPSDIDRHDDTAARLDLHARSLWRDGKQIHLTHLEFELLAYFTNNPSRAINRSELLDHVWQQPVWPGSSRTVDVHVRRLRGKLGSELRLTTVRGFGYRLDGWGRSSGVRG
jgi:Transcriptional regulatory protein, C terminal